MRYFTGHIPDDPGHFRAPFHLLAARLGIAEPPPSASLFDRAPAVMDQGNSASCTGHSVACGIKVALNLDWVPSPDGIYKNGRGIDRPRGTPLVDAGAQPAKVMLAVNEYGVRKMTPLAERYSDCDPATINAEPTWGELEAEALNVLIGDYEIKSTGAQRIRDMQTAIAAGVPLAAAIAGGCDQFQQYSGGVLPPLNAELDHYIAILSYDVQPDGTIVFGCQNSWNVFWGERGLFRISGDCAQQLGDVIALSVRRAA